MHTRDTERLRTLANSDGLLLHAITSALRAALPACNVPPVLDVANHGHWVWPMILLVDWERRNLSPQQITDEAEALRASYHAAIRSAAAAASNRLKHDLEGSAAARKAATAQLLFNLNDFKL